MPETTILLTTLNARYTHASFGLRYLYANLGEYQSKAMIKEFTIKRSVVEIVDEILSMNPKLVGFGIYIWNTDQTLAVIKLLKAKQPDLLIVAGGPEISFETETQALYPELDYVFQGEADFSFRDFIGDWLIKNELPQKKIIKSALPAIDKITLPYNQYTDEDIRYRTLYVEASRGCPYKCEYCLSSLDVSVRNFPIDAFLEQMEFLINRGARQFKFVDRTFNLSPSTSSKILEFFLKRIDLGLFLHFEMVPDRLPDELKELIQKFPPGSLQFEIGIQTWNPEVAKNVSRRQNYQKIEENLRFLKAKTGVHTHADLIVGLPGETWESFAAGFDALTSLQPDEVQVGILKRLKGTPIVRHDQTFQMRYSDQSPFQILSNRDLSAEQIRKLQIFADFWDLVANSGRFPQLMQEMRAVEGSLFMKFYKLAEFLDQKFGRTHSIHLRDLAEALGQNLNQNSPQTSALPARQKQHQQNLTGSPISNR